jgi:hypothetical protein
LVRQAVRVYKAIKRACNLPLPNHACPTSSYQTAPNLGSGRRWHASGSSFGYARRRPIRVPASDRLVWRRSSNPCPLWAGAGDATASLSCLYPPNRKSLPSCIAVGIGQYKLLLSAPSLPIPHTEASSINTAQLPRNTTPNILIDFPVSLLLHTSKMKSFAVIAAVVGAASAQSGLGSCAVCSTLPHCSDPRASASFQFNG